MARRPARLLLAASALPVAALLALWILAQRHTLAHMGRWESMKSGLERGVMGAVHFVEGRQALAGDRLDLGTWHGYQGIRLREPLELRELGVELELDEGAWLALLWDSGRRALRLSRHPLFPSALLQVTAEGAFARREPVELPAGVAEALGRGSVAVRIRFDAGATRLEIAGQALDRVAEPVSGAQWVGFRGGRESARLDDVVLELASGERLREDFDARRGALALAAALGVALLLLEGLASRRGAGGGARFPPEFPWVLANAVLALVLAGVVAVDRWVLAPRYEPLVGLDSLFARERDWVLDETDAISRALMERHGGAPRDGGLRVLAIGSSQTWGAGARREEQGFVRRLEKALEAGGGRRVEILNAGVSGQTAPGLLERYASTWIGLEPELVLLNLSNNDEDLESFETALRGFARLNRERGIRTVFIQEPNALDRTPELLSRHEVMERVGREEGVEVVPLHARLAARADGGFLWWDRVHPTSLGHRWIAEILEREIDWESLRRPR